MESTDERLNYLAALANRIVNEDVEVDNNHSGYSITLTKDNTTIQPQDIIDMIRGIMEANEILGLALRLERLKESLK